MVAGFTRAKRVASSTLNAVLWELDELAQALPSCPAAAPDAVDADVLAGAREFVQALFEELPGRPRVVVLESGKIQLVWYRGLASLEMEFTSPRTICFSKLSSEAGIVEEGTFPTDDVEFAAALVGAFRNETARTARLGAELPIVHRYVHVPAAE
jgi:hypothetical protein